MDCTVISGDTHSDSTAERSDRRLVFVTASASKTSRSERVADHIGTLLSLDYLDISHVRLRELSPDALIQGDAAEASVERAVELVSLASAIIFITPTYKGSFSGLLKTFIDLLPQYALRGKAVLPLATGGSIAHMQMLDFSLRPVLQTMWPRHIGQSCFILDNQIKFDGPQTFVTDAISPFLGEVLKAFEGIVEHP